MRDPRFAQRRSRPTHPGEFLREDFLPEFELTETAFATALGVSRQSVNELLTIEQCVGAAAERRYGWRNVLECTRSAY